jgi:ABC-type multidrug transport system fused ATPase/permease subunit
MSSQFMAFASKVPAIEIVAHLLNTTPSIPKGKKIPPFTTSIKFENVSFTYNKKDVVLQNLFLVFEYNKYYAIVGSSGCGKSTIVDLLTGFYKPDQGNILIDGVDLKYSDIGTWLPQIGVISQDTFIFSGTIEDNICFGIDEKDRDLERICSAARIAYANEFIEKMPNGYKATIGERGYQISGGQRQRLAIASALYLDPPILIFDEATSALDPISGKKVQKAIESLHGQRTVITVAHRLSTVANADHIYVIDKGRLVEEGIHQNLRSMNGLYSQLCANQNTK